MRREWRIALVAIVLFGVLIRLDQFVDRTDLWLDEVMLANSIVGRPASGLLFTPLDFNQMAPPGFLQTLKLSTVLFGPNETALRLPTLLASIAGLMAFVVLARRVLDARGTLIATAVFAVAPRILLQASEAKQYSGDVLIAILLTLIALSLRTSGYSRRQAAAAGLAGLLLVWFSDTAVIVLAGLGIGLAVIAFVERDRRAVAAARIIAPLWAAAIVGQQLGMQARMAPSTRHAMYGFWSDHFVPFPPRSLEELLWLPRKLVEMFASDLGTRTAHGAAVLVAGAGFVALWRNGKRDAALILAGPVAVGVVASMASLYPFDERLVLFLIPAFAIALVAGAGFVGRLWPRHDGAVQLALMLMLLAPPRNVMTGEPLEWRRQEMRPVLATLRANRRPGDRIYVYHSARASVAFYGERYGITRDQWTAGRDVKRDPQLSKLDFAAFRGEPRVWTVFAHDVGQKRHGPILRILDSLARRVPGEGYPLTGGRRPDTFVYLYDFSE